MTERIFSNKNVLSYYNIAVQESKYSPCVRRKYGAVLVKAGPDFYHMSAHNERVTTCCQGICARDRARLVNGERVEIGAEVHAETAALISFLKHKPEAVVLVIAGFAGERELLGEDVYPCHTCALNLKYAGIKWVYLKGINQEISPVLLSEIIEYREAEWEPDV